MTAAAAGTDTERTPLPRLAVGLVIALAAAKLAVHAATSLWRYGYFRDELYFLDLARHLDWGYVDTAPLIAIYAKVALLMGGSLPALRVLPALAGAVLVALSMLIARELGGGRYAQALTGLCILLCPAFLVIDNILSMNAFEPLFWMACIWVITRILRTGDSRLWLWFGLLAGLGLENKHSTVFFGAAVVIGLLLTAHRREFLKPWIWLGGLVALLVFLPNVVWQVQHNFATLEDLENVRRTHKNVVLGPGAFLWQQIFLLHPVLFPVWLAGLVSFVRRRQWRVLGWTYVAFFLIMFALRAKHYYLFPIYPMLLAGGAVAIDRWVERRAAPPRRWPRVAIAAVIVLAAIPIDLFLLPIFPPEKYARYSIFLGLEQVKTEVHHQSPLPQIFGDQFGWEELVGEVAGVYNSLPPEERSRTGIFAGNYGEAGAINFFGPRYGLPRAYSGHQNHFFWGPPREQYQNFIVIQWDQEDVQDHCASWEAPVTHFHPFGMAEENRPIYLCRGVKFDLQEVWPRLKYWN